MPNHVTTEIHGPQAALASLLDSDGRVDFALLIPSPENIETGGCSHSIFDGDPAATGDGTVCWYAWNTQNWGTKWNAYSNENTDGVLRFDTAWSHPFPVIKALVEKHPDVDFEVKYADEDLGSNLGHYLVVGGNVVEQPISDPDDFAAQLKYGQSYAELQAEWAEGEAEPDDGDPSRVTDTPTTAD